MINHLANPCNWVIVRRNVFVRQTTCLWQVGQETNVQDVLSDMLEFDCGHLDITCGFVNTFHVLAIVAQAYDDMMCNNSRISHSWSLLTRMMVY